MRPLGKTTHWIFALTCGVLLGNVGCERQDPSATTAENGDLTVFTTFHPTTYFAERIVGDVPNVRVVNPVPPDADPATWDPSDAALANFQQADLIIVNGAGFEEWVGYASLPEDRVVDTSKRFNNLIHSEHEVTHSHGPGGEHSHEGEYNGHVWLDPNMAMVQATQISAALGEALADHKDALRANNRALVDDLLTLDKRLKTVSQKLGDQHLLANHPAYPYLARRYDWEVTSFHIEPDELPSDTAMNEMKAAVKDFPAKLMLWESEPSGAVAQKLRAELGVEPVVFKPAESVPADGPERDYLAIMNANIDRLEAALMKSPDSE